MPSASYGGGPYYVKAVNANAYKDNGATVLMGGNINTNSSTVTNAPGMTTLGYHSGMNGAIVPGPFTPVVGMSQRFVTKAVTAGNYATMTAGRYVMMRFCSFLAGVANTSLLFGAGDFGRFNTYAPNNYRTIRYVTTGGWTYQTGKPVGKLAQNDTNENQEVFPTRALPGRITYTYKKTPTTSNYSAKTD